MANSSRFFILALSVATSGSLAFKFFEKPPAMRETTSNGDTVVSINRSASVKALPHTISERHAYARQQAGGKVHESADEQSLAETVGLSKELVTASHAATKTSEFGVDLCLKKEAFKDQISKYVKLSMKRKKKKSKETKKEKTQKTLEVVSFGEVFEVVLENQEDYLKLLQAAALVESPCESNLEITEKEHGFEVYPKVMKKGGRKKADVVKIAVSAEVRIATGRGSAQIVITSPLDSTQEITLPVGSFILDFDDKPIASTWPVTVAPMPHIVVVYEYDKGNKRHKPLKYNYDKKSITEFGSMQKSILNVKGVLSKKFWVNAVGSSKLALRCQDMTCADVLIFNPKGHRDNFYRAKIVTDDKNKKQLMLFGSDLKKAFATVHA